MRKPERKIRTWMIAHFCATMGTVAVGYRTQDIVRSMREYMPKLLREHMNKSGRNMDIHHVINDVFKYQDMYPDGYYAYWKHRPNKPRLHRPTEE